MRKPVITFDCDGVLADFTEKFTNLVNGMFGTSYTKDWPSYNATEIMSQEHFDAGWKLVQEDPYFWMTLDSFPEVPFKKIGAMLFEGVFTAYVVSRRSTSTDSDPAAHTRYWLNERGLTHLQGVIVGDQDRSVLLSLLRCDAHLDDFGDQVLELRRNGINAFLLDRPWNQDTAIHPSYRVASVDEFLELVVSQFLPLEAIQTYFSPPQVADIVPVSDFQPVNSTAHLIRDTGFRFSDLPESSLSQAN